MVPPDGIVIFGFKIYFYGILIMLGALVATWVASARAKEYGENPEAAWDILPWALVGGIIGARLWHIFTPPQSMVEQGITTIFYLTHPLEMLNFRNGGLGIPGAVLGGFVAVLIYTRRHDMSIAKWADIVAPGLALAQAIGRWGNFFNQEVYGSPTNLPWKLYIEPIRRLQEFASVEYYHPLFLYEFLWNLMNAGVLLYISRRFKEWLRPADVFLVYLIIYPVGRFFLEFLRLDPSPVAGINVNQTLMAVIALLSVGALFLRHRVSEPSAQAEPVSRQAGAPNAVQTSQEGSSTEVFEEEDNPDTDIADLKDEQKQKE